MYFSGSGGPDPPPMAAQAHHPGYLYILRESIPPIFGVNKFKVFFRISEKIMFVIMCVTALHFNVRIRYIGVMLFKSMRRKRVSLKFFIEILGSCKIACILRKTSSQNART